jgi:DNA modification methylase
MQLLEKSINEVGVIESISVTKEGTIISGHARKATFDKQGKKPKEVHLSDNEYPVIVRDDIEDNTELYYKAQILANTTSKQNIDLDTELIEEIAVEYDLDIEELGVDVVEDTETHLEAKEDDFDTTPPEIPITVLGDLYEIGEHRLLCGDSTDSDSVAKLMNGEKADMVFTDPPYGISHSGKGIKGATKENDFGEILGDNDVTIAIDAFNLCQSLFPDSSMIFWGANYYSSCLPNGYGWLVWDKQREGDTFSGAEIAYVNKGVKVDVFRHQWHGMIKASEKGEARVHPTQKPVALVEWCFNNYNAGDLILDLFLGSGSTMVAAHQLKRKCYGMELDPKYCDVIVRRMIKLDPTLVIKRNGEVTKEFNETK